MKFLCAKKLGQLAPIDQIGETVLRKIKFGDIVTVEVKKPRNIKMHRLYWALVNMVFENQERYETAEQLHNAIKLSAGIYEILTMPNGHEYRIPGSIAFDKMDDLAFRDFYNRVCDLVSKHFLPGITAEILKHEIEVMIGAKAA